MTSSFKKFTVALVGAAAVSLAGTLTEVVQAATVTYNFKAEATTGINAGQSYLGSFSFDDAQLTGTGSELASLSKLTFTFAGKTFDETFDSLAGVGFEEGQFAGLNYQADDAAVSGLQASIFGPDFFYAISSASGNTPDPTPDSGIGNVTYEKVPEPGTVLGLSALGLGLLLNRSRSKRSA
ncbi:hypothetical protein BST81_23455 [Leptolyngbya sp. 'hensonii']|uniref:PEP-CTERM sorting domain-containing protein n=1 Tax=Leptolyngbya sp. 'hensonii' TaxID=1922337 RepID=UPI00094F9550|nr:PEP-CTERM sorting domain-containing protein [Leptolyngbya sp. 'hensonii']OLP16018.1 hypothetical protein BST81_23455 [Leptolyngbya sp. 'hensonii']